jgi:chemotaxis protein MotB
MITQHLLVKVWQQMGRRKKKHDDTHVDETWLIPYADMLTLLLALFIVLFAASSVDEGKFNLISETFEEIFTGGNDLLDYPEVIEQSPNDPESEKNLPQTEDEEHEKKGEGDKDEEDKSAEEVEEPNEDTEKEQSEDTEEEPEVIEDPIQEQKKQDWEQLNALQEQIDQYFVQKGLDVMIDTSLMKEGLLITFPDGVLFASGKADVTGEAKLLAKEVSEFLVTDPPREVRIAGHTDDRPISTEKFPSNWELSAARALNFMKVLLSNTQLEAERFSSIAYGEFRPVATNNTAEGRRLNRRIEILILPYEYNDNEGQ